MGKLSFGKVLDSFCLSSCSSSCFCMNSAETQDEFESKPLIASDKSQLLRLKDVVSGKQTLAFQLKPKVRLFFLLTFFYSCGREELVLAIFNTIGVLLIFSLLMNCADGDAKGVHALQWLRKKSWETYLKDGRYVKMVLSLYLFFFSFLH